jgi:hypothetical protein
VNSITTLKNIAGRSRTLLNKRARPAKLKNRKKLTTFVCNKDADVKLKYSR